MEIINSFFGAILNIIFEAVSGMTQVGTLGVSIILFTLVAQLLLTPLKFKQQRTSRMMSKIQPELQKLQKKYANKKDQASQMAYSQEMQAIYKKYNISPLSGCLPLLIQFPLIIALYNVLQQPTRYINKLGNLYAELATTVTNYLSDAKTVIDEVIAQIPLSANAQVEINQLAENAKLSDVLSHFTTAQWDLLQTFISPEGAQALEGLLEQKHNFEFFLVNLVDSPANIFASGMMIALLVPVLAGGSTFIFNKVIMANTQAPQPTSGDVPNTAESMMKVMNIMMPIMMAFFSWTVPSGLALYWISGNVIMMAQQTIVNRIVDKQQVAFEEQLRKDREAAAAAKPKKKKKKKKPVTEAIETTQTSQDSVALQETKQTQNTKNKTEEKHQSTEASSTEKQD